MSVSLREKAIAAYEASDLRKQDTQRKKALVNEIAHFFHRMGVSASINDNPFRFDDLLFYASELRLGSGDIYGYEVIAARPCPACKKYIEATVSERFIDNEQMVENEDGNVGPVEFGRWLLEPHLCEFSLEQRKTVKGFAERPKSTA